MKTMISTMKNFCKIFFFFCDMIFFIEKHLFCKSTFAVGENNLFFEMCSSVPFALENSFCYFYEALFIKIQQNLLEYECLL